jgi:DNA-binding transcriptional ArsR family regulator
LIADPARAAMLLALLDGRALTAGELARAASVSAQSASAHLSKLVGGGMIAVHPQGRHRYYRMVGPEVGSVLETLGVIATSTPPRRLIRTPHDEALCFARTCYDHLAGSLAVHLAETLEDDGVLLPAGAGEREYALGPQGAAWLCRIGIDYESLGQSRLASNSAPTGVSSGRGRPFARRCMDWTERRPHIGGALGVTLLDRFVDRGWLARKPDTRALRVTDRGLHGFAELGVQADRVVARRSRAG